MQEYEDTVDQVKEKETQVQEEQAAIVELQQQSSDQQEAIQELYAAAYQELRTYSAELDDAKSSESALVDEINSKADAINDLIRQAKEEEIAAQKKAEEEAAAAAAAQQAAAEAEAEAARKQAAEAARVAAAEAANAAAKADTDTSSSSGSSSSDSSASSTTTGSPSASDTSSSSSSGTYLGRFKLTGYCSCSICTGQWSGGSTASGTTPTAGRTIAMGGVPFGTKLMINGQVYTVEDRGTAYGHVDIFCSSHSYTVIIVYFFNCNSGTFFGNIIETCFCCAFWHSYNCFLAETFRSPCNSTSMVTVCGSKESCLSKFFS